MEEKNKAFLENEIDANKQLVKSMVFAAILLFLMWIGYLTHLFKLNSYTSVNIFFPINIIICLSSIIWSKTKYFYKADFKYFLLFNFLVVIMILNIIVPKHGILGWAVCIILANHYYDPKCGRIIFITSVVAMLLCIYLGMFLGEYDPNLLGSGKVVDGVIYQPDTIKERFDFVNEKIKNGENRYLKVFLYYYLSRAFFLTIVFFISNGLNVRTFKLLEKEVDEANTKKQIETELNVAKEIQLNALPATFINNKKLEILGELNPAKDVGGDLYDYLILDEDNVAFLIGDVSGKGIPAAMFMMKTITCFKNLTTIDKSPAQILYEINNALYLNNASSMFVTAFLGIINTKTGLLRYANAAHNKPILKRDKIAYFIPSEAGFLLGGFENMSYTDQELQLVPGDLISLYTDGVTEARNANGEFYTENRLIHFFNKFNFASPIELHFELKDSIQEFTNGFEQSDDITLLTIAYIMDEKTNHEILVNSSTSNVNELLEFCKKCIDEENIKKEIINDVSIVIDEIASNIFKYAYQNENGPIYLRFQHNITKQLIRLTFVDKGQYFNILDSNNKALDENYHDKKAGGLGILIVKNLAQEISYNRSNNKNIVTITLDLNK